MEIATLVCNKKTDYDFAFRTYSIFEYLKSQGNQVQIIDYNIKKDKKDKKADMLYDFLSDNTIFTVRKYKTINQLQECAPLADKYLIVNGDYKDLSIKISPNNNIAYGTTNITQYDVNDFNGQYSKISTSFDINNENIQRVVDPIFLIPKEKWSEIATVKSNLNVESDYVLLYCEKATKDIIKYAMNLSQNQNLKLFIVSDKVESLFIKARRFHNVNPFNLVHLIANAKAVVTTQNDGIKLSIIFNKNLHIFTTLDDEQIDLINELNINSRIVKRTENILMGDSNYTIANELIDRLREDSYKFLKIDKNTSN